MNSLLAPPFRRVIAYVGAFALCLMFVACNGDDPLTPDPPDPPDPPPDEQTVADVIEDRDDLSVFFGALQDEGLVGSLADAEDVTVFAPNNEAFDAVDIEDADMQEVLEYHIVDGTFTQADLTDGLALETWQGGELEVTVDEDGNVFINGAQVIEANLDADNGVVHVIDEVLEPEEVDVPDEGTVVDVIAEHENLTTFHSAITDAGLETDMRIAAEITVFAPNDEAFEGVNVEEMTEDELRNTVEFHIVDGRYTATDLQDVETLETWQGGELEVSSDDEGNVFVNGAQVVEADLEADNGLVHVIDDVLEAPEVDDPPAEQTVLDVIAEQEELSDFYQALLDNELEEELQGIDELTAFAPDNDAMAEVNLEELEEEERRDLLRNHFVEGTYWAADLEEGTTLETLAGGELEVSIENESVFVNGATVTEADLEADNGVVHIIDTVLPSPENGNDNDDNNNGG